MNHPVPLRVTAQLAAGVAHSAPWGIALDGLLASELWHRHKTVLRDLDQPHTRAMDDPAPPDLDLPLARCELAGENAWHWAATCAYAEDPAPGTEVHTWIAHTDHRALEEVADKLPKVISSRQGRYRSRLVPLIVIPTARLTWHAIGDPDAITDLLQDIPAIGKKRTSGEGHVLSWTIEEAPDLPTFAAAHLHPDGTLGRPTPVGCLSEQPDLTDGGLGRAGLRPPYMHPQRQQQLHLPAFIDA